jgi:hypothetical protein
MSSLGLLLSLLMLVLVTFAILFYTGSGMLALSASAIMVVLIVGFDEVCWVYRDIK